MRIEHVDIEVTDPVSAGSYFADTLGLPVREKDGGVLVEIGRSRLQLHQGPPTEAVHHLAFDIAIDQFDDHRVWLEGHGGLLHSADGTTEFEGSPVWNSRSLYFEGPDRMVLEVIGRRVQSWPGSVRDQPAPNLLSISEVGVAVPDVAAAVRELDDRFGVGTLGEPGESFAPAGDHDGLLILVSPGRGWLPIFDVQAQPLRTRIQVDVGHPGQAIALNDLTTVTTG